MSTEPEITAEPVELERWQFAIHPDDDPFLDIINGDETFANGITTADWVVQFDRGDAGDDEEWDRITARAERVVAMQAACRGMPNEALEPGSVAELRADRAALIDLLVRPCPSSGWFADGLPRRSGGYPGGEPCIDNLGSWWFERREDAEAAVMWAAREGKGDGNGDR